MENDDKKVDIQNPLLSVDLSLEPLEPAQTKEYPVNMGYLHLYCAILGLSNFQVGWVLSGGNQS